jgi:hypothetical protein
MSIISIMVPDEVVVIDREIVSDVSMVGIPPNYHNISWYDTEGWIEPVYDIMSGEPKPPNTRITDLTPFMTQITYAQQVIDLRQNPEYYYSTAEGVFSDGDEYGFSNAIQVLTPNFVPPAQSTALVPPTPESFQELYWSGTAWVLSAFPISLNLVQAQANLSNQVKANGADAVNLQSRIYSVLDMLNETQPGDLPAADYPSMSLTDYQTYIDGEVSTLLGVISAATTVQSLYSFDPTVNPVP